MNEQISFNSGIYNSITVFATFSGKQDESAHEINSGFLYISAGNTGPGESTCITKTDARNESASGVSYYHIEKKFCYPKCESFTALLRPHMSYTLNWLNLNIHYIYLFKDHSGEPILQVFPRYLNNSEETASENGSDHDSGSTVWSNQNVFHYTPPVGFMGDPNGLCFYHDLYHMFYQFSPASQKWGDVSWGHAVSHDLLHWSELPVCFSPQQELLFSDSIRGGAFSGSALIEQDKMHLFFTRHIGDLKKEHQLEYTVSTSSEDGFSFSGEQILIKDIPGEFGTNFRDPKVWKESDGWYMLTGTETASHAAIALHRSSDLVHWEYAGVFYEEKDPTYLRAECPSITKIDGRYLLIVGYHNRKKDRIRRDTVYYLGTIRNGRFQVETKGILDEGKDFYAAQLFANLDEPVLLAWNNDLAGGHIEELCRSNGSMILPRKLWVEGKKLYSFPIPDTDALFGEEIELGECFSLPDGRGHLNIKKAEETEGSLTLLRSEKGLFTVHATADRLELQINQEQYVKQIRIREIDVFMDHSLIELFINHGEISFTRRYEQRHTEYYMAGTFEKGTELTWGSIKE